MLSALIGRGSLFGPHYIKRVLIGFLFLDSLIPDIFQLSVILSEKRCTLIMPAPVRKRQADEQS